MEPTRTGMVITPNKKQSAITDIFLPGVVSQLGSYHADVSSMYPSIATKFNISVETTRWVKFTPYNGVV